MSTVEGPRPTAAGAHYTVVRAVTMILKLGVVNYVRSHWVRCGSEPGDSGLLSTTKLSSTPGIRTSDPFDDRRLTHLTTDLMHCFHQNLIWRSKAWVNHDSVSFLSNCILQSVSFWWIRFFIVMLIPCHASSSRAPCNVAFLLLTGCFFILVYLLPKAANLAATCRVLSFALSLRDRVQHDGF